MTTITVHAPIKVSAPRATQLAAALFTRLLGWFENRAAAAAQRHLQATRGRESQAVRQYALHFVDHDPRFAADLLAAADRHEQGE